MAKRKPSAAQVRARALFAARFGGEKAKRVARKVRTVAKRSRNGRKGGRRFGGFRLNTKAILQGGAAGALTPIAAGFIGPRYGPAAASIAVGAMTGNETLQTVGGFQLGTQLVSGSGLPGAGNAPAGGYL